MTVGQLKLLICQEMDILPIKQDLWWNSIHLDDDEVVFNFMNNELTNLEKTIWFRSYTKAPRVYSRPAWNDRSDANCKCEYFTATFYWRGFSRLEIKNKFKKTNFFLGTVLSDSGRAEEKKTIIPNEPVLKPGQWNCAMCTYINEPSRNNCEMCEGAKPV